jgi:hypothetical protein
MSVCTTCGEPTGRIRQDRAGGVHCPSCFVSVAWQQRAGYDRCADCNQLRQPEWLVTVVNFDTGEHRDVCHPTIVCRSDRLQHVQPGIESA